MDGSRSLKIFRGIFHFASAFQFAFTIYHHHHYVKLPADLPEEFKKILVEPEEFGGIFKFFTVQNAVLLVVYFSLAFLDDLIGSNEHSPKQTPLVRKVKDYLFASIAFPCSLGVTFAFWGLYAINRELIFPKFFDRFFPQWLNHVYHTNITVFIILELFFSFRQYPSRKSCLTGLAIFIIGYFVWMHFVYFETGLWIYPFLMLFNFPIRLVIFVINIGICVLLYRLGEFLNNQFWIIELNQSKMRKET